MSQLAVYIGYFLFSLVSLLFVIAAKRREIKTGRAGLTILLLIVFAAMHFGVFTQKRVLLLDYDLSDYHDILGWIALIILFLLVAIEGFGNSFINLMTARKTSSDGNHYVDY